MILQTLDEVVVVGYGTQKKVNVTGAVGMVDSKVIAARPVQNVSQALQGVIPGLNLTVGNSGGSLDGEMNINIRGTGTIGDGSGSSPLVLIDGIEGNLNTVNPNDIESCISIERCCIGFYLRCQSFVRCYLGNNEKR